MFELGTTAHWWKAAKKYPMLSKKENTLKPLGYAEAINLIEENGANKILEIGHGTGSFIFELFYDNCEIWGLDDTVEDNYVPEEDLKRYRKDYEKVKFINGLLGQNNPALPRDYFDMVYSVSTVEHIPAEEILPAFEEAFSLLKPGGIMYHSLDVYYGKNVRNVFDAIQNAGFEWLKGRETMNVVWEKWLCDPDMEFINKLLPVIVFENPMIVAEIYMWQKNREERDRPWNWLTILIAGKKPLDGNPHKHVEPELSESTKPVVEVNMVKPKTSFTSVNDLEYSENYLKPENFDYFTYSKNRHYDFFKRLMYDKELFGMEVDPGNADLKVYQDLMTFSFIKQNYDGRIKILDVGGGTSRILDYFKGKHECWNIDKLEGVGNGPLEASNEGIRFVYDYMGNFNKELPDNYFDLVFSISTLEHVPTDDPQTHENVLKDINRVLKPGCYSLHSMDVVWLGEDYVWTNELLNFLFKNQKMLNKFVPFEKLIEDEDLYHMSEEYFNKNWSFTTGKTFEEFGRPLSYNFIWKKE